MLKLIKSIDIYGHQVGVNYKGSPSYNTLFGSLMTILTSVIVLIYALDQLCMLTTHQNQEISTRIEKINLQQTGQVYLREYDYNYFLTVLAYLENGNIEMNYEIPETIGSWDAYADILPLDDSVTIDFKAGGDISAGIR